VGWGGKSERRKGRRRLCCALCCCCRHEGSVGGSVKGCKRDRGVAAARFGIARGTRVVEGLSLALFVARPAVVCAVRRGAHPPKGAASLAACLLGIEGRKQIIQGKSTRRERKGAGSASSVVDAPPPPAPAWDWGLRLGDPPPAGIFLGEPMAFAFWGLVWALGLRDRSIDRTGSPWARPLRPWGLGRISTARASTTERGRGWRARVRAHKQTKEVDRLLRCFVFALLCFRFACLAFNQSIRQAAVRCCCSVPPPLLRPLSCCHCRCRFVYQSIGPPPPSCCILAACCWL